DEPRGDRRAARGGQFSPARRRPAGTEDASGARRRGDGPRGAGEAGGARGGLTVSGAVDGVDAEPEEDAQRLATEARDRVRFEEDALALSDQVYRVARHLANSREDAEELVQETYARAFRSWRQFTPGTNLRAWLLRILTNLN